MEQTGILHKLKGTLSDDGIVSYALPLGDSETPLNPLIEAKIKLTFTGTIRCINCDAVTKTSFSQGYCRKCSQTLARCDMCVVRPETCHFSQGTCREPNWAREQCFIPHTIYLANSSGLKVGITRGYQRKTRWIDQGAVQAIPIMEVANRKFAGLIEKQLSGFVADKTNWRKMLSGPGESIDLEAKRSEILAKLRTDIPYQELHDEALTLVFPVKHYPEKISSLSFDKQPTIEARLMGIKGQYLIFDNGVLNMRKHQGYELEVVT